MTAVSSIIAKNTQPLLTLFYFTHLSISHTGYRQTVDKAAFGIGPKAALN